ncbi:chemotaxis protein MotC [Mesorhizobium sp. BE184]|uniref:chemotaxis protein MotC n=1 Tax=Mesorhizobium sp. BE184 TaxID=2817714 RepID=UPI0028625952|nr:chemotaxis protein MotC [Mesorhizobium sp. BE184]MDR7034691.1 chemotaxis protein MotC [Mesorhizobium sp. BE184]
MRRAVRLCVTIGIALGGAGLATASHAAEPLQPYQLVRSLQLVQDKIAAGDHAALPMQGKLLELIDARMRSASPQDFADPKNFRALLVYGMSGGNPSTVGAATARIELDAVNKDIAAGIVAYLGGRPAEAIKLLEPMDPMRLSPDLGAFVALVKGSLLALEKPKEALTLLDQARLLSPGTLVEEAALRRSVGIAVAEGDAARFVLASTQYVERFLHSPYASQFADSFASGVIALHMAVSQDKLADIVSMMDPEREKVIYLRIARRAAIDGLNDLSAFAASKAEEGRNGKDNEDDPRALLYASLSSMTSASVAELREKLGRIDRSQLSPSDRDLFDAARAVTHEIVTAPAKAAVEPHLAVTPKPPIAIAAPDGKAVAEKAVEPDGDTSDLPPVEGIASERPAAGAETVVAAEPPALPQPVAAPRLAAGLPKPQAAALVDETDKAIADTKRRLNAIDQLLGASPQ